MMLKEVVSDSQRQHLHDSAELPSLNILLAQIAPTRRLSGPHSHDRLCPAKSNSSHTSTHTAPIAIMADRGGAAPAAGGRGGGFGGARGGGDRGGDRGRGRGGRRGPRRGGNKSEEKEWQPVTKLGRLVKAGKIKSMEEIYLHSLPIKEYQIVDFFLPKLKDEVMKVCGHDTLLGAEWNVEQGVY